MKQWSDWQFFQNSTKSEMLVFAAADLRVASVHQ
jgi:hypothetical protein